MPRASSERVNERRRALKRGEVLAMHPEAIRRDDRGAFFFLFGPSIARNERIGPDDKLAVVNVRGPLDQFSDCWGDNYESIANRVIEAMTGVDQVREIKRKRQEAYWMGETDEMDRSDVEPAPPHCVVLRLSSPGGVVAGLWECVKKLRSLSEKHNIPLIAYVDEMAASAAYALACACDEIYLPQSGVVGSIGVISHMFSVARANEEDGIDVEVIASGDQKADGNENLPITDDAKTRETARVMKLAKQFFRVVAKARALSPAKVQGFEAGIFLGSDGVKAGLANDVMGWDAFLDQISLAYTGTSVTPSSGVKPDSGVKRDSRKGESMTQLLALIAQTKKDLAKATGAKRKALSDKLARLSASLTDLRAYKKTTKKMEETKEESEDPPEEDESEDDEKDKDAEDEESDDDAESEESDEDAEGDDKDKDAEGDDDKKESKRSRKSDDDAESDDDKKDAEGDDADDEALLASIRDPKKRGQLAARLGEARQGRVALREVRKLAAERKREKRNALIDAKLAGHFITKAEAKWLKRQQAATVESFLDTRKKPILKTDETAEIPDDRGRPDVAAHISDQEFKMIEAAYLASGGKVPLEKFVEDFKRGAHKPNGITGAHTTPTGGSR